MAKAANRNLTNSSLKVVELGNQLLDLEGHMDWEIDEIHLIPKDGGSEDKVVCNWVKEGGEWVLKCLRP